MMASRGGGGFARMTRGLWSTNTFCVLFLLISVYTLSVYAIECYECNSHHPNQEDCKNFNTLNETKKASFLVNCTIPPYVSDAGYSFCRTVYLELKKDKDKRIIRSCGYYPHKDNYTTLCFKADNEGYTETICQCMTERCNSAPRSISSLNVAVVCFGVISLLLSYLH